MDYLGVHRTNFLDLIPIPSWRNALRGSMLYCQYRTEKGSEPKFYLLIDTKSFIREQLIHVLDLKFINPSIIENRLMKHTVQKMPLEESYRGKPYTRFDFKVTEKYFYGATIKPLINNEFANSYRTIDPLKLSSIKLVNYKWKEGRKKSDQGISKKEFDMLQSKTPGTQDVSKEFQKQQENKK